MDPGGFIRRQIVCVPPVATITKRHEVEDSPHRAMALAQALAGWDQPTTSTNGRYVDDDISTVSSRGSGQAIDPTGFPICPHLPSARRPLDTTEAG